MSWLNVTLGDVVELQRGYDITASERREGPYPVVSSSGVAGTHSEAKVSGPGVVTGRYGTIGQVFYIREDFWPTNTTLFVKDFKGNDPLFVSFLLRTVDWASCSDKSSVPGINRNHAHLLPVQVPSSIEDQRVIAYVLGTLDDKIELNRRMNETLEAMARAIFKSWFVDFDPVRAKAEGRQLDGMDTETADLFPDAFQDSPLGKIPRGWTSTTLGSETAFLTGFAFKSDLFLEKPPGIRLARGDNVKEGFFHWDFKSRYWPQVTMDIERYQLEARDVLIGMDGSKVGKNWVRVRGCDLPCLLVQRVARFRTASSVGDNFIWLLISDSRFESYVEAVKTGTSIPHVSGGQLKSFEFIRPPKTDNRIFERFEYLVASLCERIDINIEQSLILATLRETLLPKLLSGEVRVNDVERGSTIPSEVRS